MGPMPNDADALIALYRRCHDALAARAGSLSSDDVRAQSYCTEWNVADVLSHLGSGAVIGLATMRAAVAGEELPGQDFNQPVWDEWNAKSPEAKAADFVPADEALVAAWEGLSDDELASIHVERFGMQLDAAGLVRMRLSEFVFHAWDVEVAFDPDARLMPDALPSLLERAPMMARYMAHPEGDMKGKVVEIETIEPAGRYTLDLGDPVSLTPTAAGSGPADVVLTGEAFARLSFGRLDKTNVPDGAKVSDDLLGVFAPR